MWINIFAFVDVCFFDCSLKNCEQSDGPLFNLIGQSEYMHVWLLINRKQE